MLRSKIVQDHNFRLFKKNTFVMHQSTFLREVLKISPDKIGAPEMKMENTQYGTEDNAIEERHNQN